ncbi:MAG: TonB-dependent receptor [Acidobacteria bacterium]|nr:TonB-dependent receptor [Acidobacteriota bacterium]
MRLNLSRVCLCLLLGGVLAAAAIGQAVQTTGRIEGTIKDSTGGVIPGVTVSLASATGTKTAVSGDSGEYSFPFLTPGLYTLKAELESFKTFEQKDITVRLGQTTTIHVVMEPGEINQVITVTGEAPLVDTTTTTVGANLSENLYLNIPVQRNFTALFSMAPGVSDSGALGSYNPSIGGSSGLENNYIVDGVNITNPGYGSVGAYSSIYGSLGSGVTFDFVKEVQVKQGGFEAEYGQSTGGVINVVTKSGTNEFHGGVYFYGQPAGWEARRKEPNIYRQEKHTEFMRTESFDISADLSGYMWKDRFFFYAGFNPQWNTHMTMAPAGLGQWVNPGEGFFERKDTIFSWSTKGNFVPHSNHNIEFSMFADPSRRDGGPNRNMTAEGDDNYSELNYGSFNFIGRYNGVLTNNWFLTASLGRAYNRFEEQITHVDRIGYWDYVNYPSRQLMGGIGFFENNNGENWQFNLKTTVNFNAGGDHTLDFGYMYEDVTYTAVRRYTGPMLANPFGETYGGFFRYRYYPDPDTGENYDWNGDGVISDADALLQQYRGNFNDPNLATTTTYHSFYVQDAWKVTDRITVKAGLRYDYQEMGGGGEEAIVYEFTGNWAPRIGLIYDVFGDGKTKVFGNWGRFYQKIPNDMAVRALSSEVGVTNAWWSVAYDAEGRPMADEVINDQLPGNPAITRTGANPTYIVPDTKTMYQNEFVLGFDHQLDPTLSLGMRYIWREVGRMLEDTGTLTIGQYLEDDTNYTYVIANPSYTSDFVINDTGEVGSDGIGDGFADPKRSYNALEMTLEKRFSQGFQFLANYRLSKLWGNYEGLFRNDNGQDDANITSLYDFRSDAYDGYLYVPGYLNTDRRHILNFNGSYTFSNQLTMGLGFRSTSGAPINRLNAHPAYENAGEIPITPRGSEGRTEWVNAIDVHFGYPISFGDNYRLHFALDIFNLANFKRVIAVNEDYEDAPGVLNVDYLSPGSANNPDTPLTAFQRPFNMRFSLRFEF